MIHANKLGGSDVYPFIAPELDIGNAVQVVPGDPTVVTTAAIPGPAHKSANSLANILSPGRASGKLLF